jgi:biopolymer transport protein ExbB/TolQ
MTKAKKDLIGLLTSGALVIVGPLAGIAVTTFLLRRSFADTANVAPSRKQELLARGISESMYATAAGIVVGVIAMIVAIVFAVRLARSRS